MTPMQRWSWKRVAALRTGADRAATLVEYALVSSLLLVVSLVAIDGLSTAADGEINNQAECVSDRPPPTDGDVECQFAPVPPDVTAPDPDVVPPTTAPPNPNPDVFEITAGSPTESPDGGWTIILPVSVERQEWSDPMPEPEPAEGIEVRARIRLRDPNNPSENLPDPGFTDCDTDAAGECDLEYTVPFPDVEAATMEVIHVGSPNPPDDLPPTEGFVRPSGW